MIHDSVDDAGAVDVTWPGTFAAVLIPGAVVGTLLGRAEHRRRPGHHRVQRWLVLAPLLFPVAALSLPGAITTLLTTGQGGGAIGLVLFGMLGAIALSGRGQLWVRLLCAVLAFFPGASRLPEPTLPPRANPGTPRGAWVGTHCSALYLILAIACTIPQRRTRPATRSP